ADPSWLDLTEKAPQSECRSGAKCDRGREDGRAFHQSCGSRVLRVSVAGLSYGPRQTSASHCPFRAFAKLCRFRLELPAGRAEVPFHRQRRLLSAGKYSENPESVDEGSSTFAPGVGSRGARPAAFRESTGRNTMNRRTLMLATIALFSFAIALPAGDAGAQQMQRVSYKTPAT